MQWAIMTLLDRLREVRGPKTSKALAEALGMSPTSLSHALAVLRHPSEHGRKRFSVAEVASMVDFYGVEFSVFVDRDSKERERLLTELAVEEKDDRNLKWNRGIRERRPRGGQAGRDD